ncbi:6403_t:CDS:2 [Dentiscutata heterogama]|uniref:6403_t:CDS:1 n=1 Tax=Dentiscutata heterogama TaxID=1316150 RepID=A0ACA9KYN0_9GLOM|nr:6403_t:CDS:2 [Dentiscutata heterogama]
MNSIINNTILFKFLFIYLLIQISKCANLPGSWPPLDKPPPTSSAYTALVDLKKVPNAAVRSSSDSCPNTGSDPYCTWSCTNCIRNQTDYITCPNSGDWGLTFDDGPSPYTPALLDFLDAHNIKATFFVVGSRVVENPDILQRAYKSGHQIGVHTWSHPSLTTQSTEQVIAELQWTADVIKAAIGVTPKYMRPPFGDYDDRIRSICDQLGYKIVIWDRDTNDWLSDGDKSFNLNWVEGNFTQWVKEGGKAGHISLEHDLYSGAAAQGPKVVPILTTAGYNIKPVGTCLGTDSFYKESNTTLPVSSNSSSTPTNTLNTLPTNTNAPINQLNNPKTQSTPPSTPSSSLSQSTSLPAGKKSLAIKSSNFDHFLWSIIIGAILFNSAFIL